MCLNQAGEAKFRPDLLESQVPETRYTGILRGRAPQGVVAGEEPARDPVGDERGDVPGDRLGGGPGRGDVEGAHADALGITSAR